MARRRRSLLGNKKSKVGKPPTFGSVKPPADATSDVTPDETVSTQDLTGDSGAKGLSAEESTADMHDVDPMTPASDATADTMPVNEEALDNDSPKSEADTFDFFSAADLPAPVQEPVESDDIAQVEAAEPAPAPSSGVNERVDRFFDLADLPDLDSSGDEDDETFEADSGEWESDTLDDVFSFDDINTDIPEDPAAMVEALSRDLDASNSDEDSYTDSDLFPRDRNDEEGVELFEDDDFSDLRRDETDVPEDPAFVESVLAEYGVQPTNSSDTLVPQEMTSTWDENTEEDEAFSGMNPIPEDEATGQFRRDSSFNFSLDSDDSLLEEFSDAFSQREDSQQELEEDFPNMGTSIPEEKSESQEDSWGFEETQEDEVPVDKGLENSDGIHQLYEFGDESIANTLDPEKGIDTEGFGGFGGFGDELPPTEEVPTAVLEDLASPHYASMTVPDAPGLADFGDPDPDADPDDALVQPKSSGLRCPYWLAAQWF